MILHPPNLPISISQGNPRPSLVSDRISFMFCKPYSLSRRIMYLRELSRSCWNIPCPTSVGTVLHIYHDRRERWNVSHRDISVPIFLSSLFLRIVLVLVSAFFFSAGHLLNVARPALISISLYCRLGDAERRWVSCTDHGLMRLPRPHTNIPDTRQDRVERERKREREKEKTTCRL